MPKELDPKTANDFIRRAVTALAGDEAVKKLSPSLDAGFNLAHQNAVSQGKREAHLKSITINVVDGSKGDDNGSTVIAREPIGAMEKRTPISAMHGSFCTSITVGNMIVVICATW